MQVSGIESAGQWRCTRRSRAQRFKFVDENRRPGAPSRDRHIDPRTGPNVRPMLRALALTALLTLALAPGAGAQGVRLNHLQAVGSHNSYHEEVSPREKQLRSLDGATGELERSLEYAYPRLAEQVGRQNVRQIELDLFADPVGGRYAAPLVRLAAGLGPLTDPALYRPGTKVLHIQDYDYRSTCSTLVACLREVKALSDAVRDHVPFAILLEFKDDPLPAGLPGVGPLAWTPERIAAAEAEIRSVFPADRVLTPDNVRGSRATLREALARDGWPTIARARGQVLFLMDNEDLRARYLAQHPNLAGALLFTNSRPGQPDGAFVKVNDPRGTVDGRSVPDLVRDRYVVRTRADADTREARTNDTSTRDAALASGAQWVSTDYPAPGYSARFGTNYAVTLGRPARCNPVSAPAGCRDAVLGR